MSDPTPKVIPGTDTGLYVGSPVFSPDGRSIAYVTIVGSGGAINTISLDGGAPVTIAQTRAAALPGLSWGDGGVLYSDPDVGIMRVGAVGQKPEVIVPIGPGEAMQGPSMLPGGAAAVFSVSKGREAGIAPTLEAWDAATIVAKSLPNGGRKTLIQGGSDPHYLPTGHLLYARGGTMYLAPFDPKRLEVTGASIPVLEGVARTLSGRASTGYAQVAFSQTGSLVYLTGPAAPTSEPPKLVMIDRTGKVEPLNVPSDFYERPRVSPDGRFVAVGTEDAKGAALWIHDVSGTTALRRLTFDGRNRYPVWSHDGAHIAFQSDIEGDSAIFVQRSDGSTKAERLTKPEKDTAHTPEAWSGDGKHLLYAVSQGGANALWTYAFDSKTSTPFGDVRSPRLISSTFSPNGRWVAYTAGNSGQNQVLVQPFPVTGAKYLVGSGARPQWSPDGAEIFYYRNEGTFVRKVTTTQTTFTVSNEAELPFNIYAGRGPGGGRDADIMPDGKRFVAVVTSTGPANSFPTIRQLQVVLNWFEEVKPRVPVK
jgi:Tol biopolymer transport system component